MYDFYDTDYPQFERLTTSADESNCTEYDSINCTDIRTIGGQVIHDCAENYAADADGNCLKLDDSLNSDAITSYIKKARANIISFVEYIFNDYTDPEFSVEEYDDYEEAHDTVERTMKLPR